MTPEEFSTILERISQDRQTEEDLEKLRSLRLEGGVVQWVSQDGKFNTNVGQITGGEVHIGDRIYQGADAEAIRSLIENAFKKPAPTYKRPRLVVSVLVGFGVAVGIISIRLTGLLQFLELPAYDLLFRTKPFFEKSDDRIAIVEIQNEEISKFGSSEISDRKLQQILEKLVAANPHSIGLDIFRDEAQADPDAPNEDKNDYQNLTKFLEENQITVACQVDSAIVEGSNFPSDFPIDKVQLGFSNVVVDGQSDSKTVRRQLLSMPNNPNAECQTSYSLGYKLALDYLQDKSITESRTEETNYIQLGDTVFEPVWSNTGGYQGIDDGGYQILLNYRRTLFNNVFSATEILDGLDAEERAKIENRIVLVGYDETGATEPLDLFETPLGTKPGVELHAYTTSHILSTVISDKYTHPLIKTWAEPEEIIWITLWCLAGSISAWIAGSKEMLIIMTVGGTVLVIAIAWSAFAFGGWWLPLIPPVLGLVLTSAGTVVLTRYQILQKR